MRDIIYIKIYGNILIIYYIINNTYNFPIYSNHACVPVRKERLQRLQVTRLRSFAEHYRYVRHRMRLSFNRVRHNLYHAPHPLSANPRLFSVYLIVAVVTFFRPFFAPLRPPFCSVRRPFYRVRRPFCSIRPAFCQASVKSSANPTAVSPFPRLETVAPSRSALRVVSSWPSSMPFPTLRPRAPTL